MGNLIAHSNQSKFLAYANEFHSAGNFTSNHTDLIMPILSSIVSWFFRGQFQMIANMALQMLLPKYMEQWKKPYPSKLHCVKMKNTTHTLSVCINSGLVQCQSSNQKYDTSHCCLINNRVDVQFESNVFYLLTYQKKYCYMSLDKDNYIQFYHEQKSEIYEFIAFLKANYKKPPNSKSQIYKLISSQIGVYSSTNVGTNKWCYSSIILPEAQMKDLDQSIRNFTDPTRIEKLQMLGFKNNLSMLLHGPPGTSKTSMSFSIARRLNRDIFIVDKSNAEGFFDNISDLALSTMVVLFDDIDFWDLDQRKLKTHDEISKPNDILMKLMEMLNGNVYDSACFVFTANYIDKIDSALFRPGRIHLKLEITEMQDMTVYNKFFENIYNDVGGDWRKSFSDQELQTLFSKKMPLCKVSEMAKQYLFDKVGFIQLLKSA